jgi:hypothetical protein
LQRKTRKGEGVVAARGRRGARVSEGIRGESEDKEEREQGEWLAWSMEGSHAPRVPSWERLQGASFSCSVKKSEMSGCRERSGPKGDCNPFFFLFFFPKIKKKKDREERNMRRGEKFCKQVPTIF